MPVTAPDRLHDHVIDLDTLKMREDWCLVRWLPEPEGVVIQPKTEAQKRFGLKTGEVLRCGPGDTLLAFACRRCTDYSWFPKWKFNHSRKRQPRCPKCHKAGQLFLLKGTEKSKGMAVNVGDKVIFTEGNDEIMMNGEVLYIVHEEQHIMGVVG